MAVKIPEVNIYPNKLSLGNVKKHLHPRNILSSMASGGFLPVIALEAFVESGRTYQAYKRGGFDEARERITEEFSGAVFWLGGVTGLNWLFEKLGRKLLKLPNHTVDIASDDVRKPLDNFLAQEKRTKNVKLVDEAGKTVKGTLEEAISPKLMARFKFVKVISSVLIANAFIGFILPKINQAITRSYHKNDNKKNIQQNNPNTDNFIKRPDLASFAGTNNTEKAVSFGALNYLKIADAFENNRNVRLLSVDAGTASGRAISARNNNERVEILFRDLSSIYFYMFCMGHMNSLLNRIEQGWSNKNTSRLDPVSAKFATQYMDNYLAGRNIPIEEFGQNVLGDNKELPKSLLDKFASKKVITVEEFIQEIPQITKSAQETERLEKIAQKMSELQPQVKGQSILTKAQVKNIVNGGLINDPEFLKAFFTNAYGNTKFMDKYKFISQNSLNDLKDDLTRYVKSIIEDAKKANLTEISSDLLAKASRKNFKLNALNWGSGFAISALFLSTLIPKMQYLITKLRTGQDAFPGTEQYRHSEEIKQAA